jgi:hypothetical protein
MARQHLPQEMVQRRRAKGQALPDRAYKCLWSFLSPFETIIGCSNPEFNPHWGFKCDSGSRGSLVVHDRRALRDQPRDEAAHAAAAHDLLDMARKAGLIGQGPWRPQIGFAADTGAASRRPHRQGGLPGAAERAARQ